MRKNIIIQKKQNDHQQEPFFSSKSAEREAFFPAAIKPANKHHQVQQRKDDFAKKQQESFFGKPIEREAFFPPVSKSASKHRQVQQYKDDFNEKNPVIPTQVPELIFKNEIPAKASVGTPTHTVQMFKLRHVFKKIGKKIGRFAKKALKIIRNPIVIGLIKKGLSMLPGIGAIVGGFSVLGKLGSLGRKVAGKLFNALAKFKGKFKGGFLSKAFKFLGKIKGRLIGKLLRKMKGGFLQKILGWALKGKSLLGNLAKKLLIKFLLLFDKRKKPDFSNPAKKQQVLLRARLARAVYGGADLAQLQQQTGYAPATPLQLSALAITPNDLQDDNCGFYAEIYADTSTPTKYMLAFRGSAPLTNFLSASSGKRKDALNDWIKTNLLQSLGIETRQYKKAAAIAIKMKTAVGINGFEIVGHSLGGGLASIAAAVTGANATTFNAAGLHEKTTAREGVSKADRSARAANVEAYSSKTDPLTLAQNFSPLPDAYGKQYVLNSKGHDINAIIAELEK